MVGDGSAAVLVDSLRAADREMARAQVSVRPDLDGVSFLSACLSSVDAASVDLLLEALAGVAGTCCWAGSATAGTAPAAASTTRPTTPTGHRYIYINEPDPCPSRTGPTPDNAADRVAETHD